jgi:signal transduction histidine kinase/CheY-like chemotaxis protein
METERLPLHKSNISMEFASMELENAYPQDPNGAFIRIPNSFTPAPAWLQLFKGKSSLWSKPCGAAAALGFPLHWLSYSRAKVKALARELKNAFTPTSKRQAMSYFFQHRVLSFLSKNKKFRPETYHPIQVLNTKASGEALLPSPTNNKPPEGILAAENSFFARQEKPSRFWEDAEELAKTGFWEFNVKTGKLSCSGNALKLVNKQVHLEEIDFKALIAHFNEADKTCLAENWHQLVHQGQPFEYNARITDLFGDKWIKIKGKAIEETSTIVKIIGFFQDITETKVLEQSLTAARVNAELEMKAKSDFVSVVTHEIRTPLNGISGFTYLLLQDDVSREEQKDYLRSIQFSTQNVLALINKTLDYSKIEAGKVEFEKISFQLPDLLADIHRSFYLRAAEKKVNLYLDINPATPDVAVGDPGKLCQILNNLISNAIKFTQEGEVKISVDVVYESEADWVMELIVSDTGVGIPAEKQPLIFESFTQAHASTNRQFGGTGLGLAITKKLVELQNGSIQLHSVPGQGSQFLIRLKLAKPDPAHMPVLRPDIQLNHYAGLQGAKILVVDDNALNRNVACKLLSNWQVKADTADNGLEAIKKVKASPYDIILMDLFMPVMDGFEAIAQIKAFGIKTPIIALTGNILTEEENKVLDLGVQDYVTKPFNPQELYKTILEHLVLTEV